MSTERVKIIGVPISAVNMESCLENIFTNLEQIKGDYICVSNVHTTVMAHDNPEYMKVQSESYMSVPDGKPLSVVGRKTYPEMDRVTGPDLMRMIFEQSAEKKYRHYFYGSTDETLEKLKSKLFEKYPDIRIAGMYSPPFRPMTEEEDEKIIEEINKTNPDFVWIGLGAPKQENWMASHKGKINGLMVGVGAGFDYHADNIKRAPRWMQNVGLEWMYRLLQDPKRLLKRYLMTNTKFIWCLITGR